MLANVIATFTGAPARTWKASVAFLDAVPTPIMLCDAALQITYVNPASREALHRLRKQLPINPDAIIGQSIDIFHKTPSHQRRLLADRSRLPHQARIRLGEETMDLYIAALPGTDGYMLSWSIVTDLVRKEAEVLRLMNVLDLMPINVMLADGETMNIVYANRTSINTLRLVERHLPCKADEVVGKSIDIFHKNPMHQRKMLGDYKNTLPHRAIITLGDDKLELNIAALNGADGHYIGPIVTWGIVTDTVRISQTMQEVAGTVSAAATELNASAEAMLSASGRGVDRAGAVAAAAEQLSASIAEISRQIDSTQKIAHALNRDAEESKVQAQGLSSTSQNIGMVLNLITDIAEQTNLLALNATIEAARAGEAGKGFAVVAAEVKALATQTAKATQDIGGQVAGIKDATAAVLKSNTAINATISELNGITATVAAAVEEQAAATRDVAANIAEVSNSAGEIGSISNDVNSAAGELAERASALSDEVKSFLSRFSTKKK